MTGKKSATQILLDWWQAKRGARAMPARAEVDPVELKAILPKLMLIDVTPAPDGPGHVFTCRLAGTEIDDRFGVRLTGLTLDRMPFGDTRDKIQRQYESAATEARPVCCSHDVVVAGSRYVEYDRLVVPLSGKLGAEVTALIAAIDFKCAHLLEQGRLSTCCNGGYCDQIDLCLVQASRL